VSAIESAVVSAVNLWFHSLGNSAYKTDWRRFEFSPVSHSLSLFQFRSEYNHLICSWQQLPPANFIEPRVVFLRSERNIYGTGQKTGQKLRRTRQNIMPVVQHRLRRHKNGPGDVSYSADHHRSGCEYFGGCLFRWVSKISLAR